MKRHRTRWGESQRQRSVLPLHGIESRNPPGISIPSAARKL